MSCPMCGGTQYNDSDFKLCDALGISICKECSEKVEKHHQVDGRFKVIKCKECKHIKEIKWIPYKKKGRPRGSRNLHPDQRTLPLVGNVLPNDKKKNMPISLSPSDIPPSGKKKTEKKEAIVEPEKKEART
ncbi:MAG: hypothetical protein MUP55_01510 [Candidatus Aenigmarchaeota archaeon]|nr:hypothetical protein [Candidatus Aenigmarchaeota archaeon]